MKQNFQIGSLSTCNQGSTLCIVPYLSQNGLTFLNLTTKEHNLFPTRTSRHSSVAIDNDAVFAVDKAGVTKYNRNGDVICQFAEHLSSISDICIGPDGMVYIGAYIRRFHGVLVYYPAGQLSHELTRSVHPSSMAFDPDGYLHVCDIKRNFVKVYNINGKFVFTYGKDLLTNPTSICIHPDGFAVVLECVSLAVFRNKQYLYSIDVSKSGISDIAITYDGALWIASSNELIQLPSLAIYQPPPPLSLLCQSTILLHMAELPVSLLPPKYSKQLQEWSQAVDINISLDPTLLASFVDSQTCEQHRNETISVQNRLQLKPGINEPGIRIILEKKLGVSCKDCLILKEQEDKLHYELSIK